jgi:hypothetical protein
MLLARMLKTSQNVELKDWRGATKAGDTANGDESKAADAGLALNVLLGLARYSKAQWRILIDGWGLDLDIRRSDSVRDVLGRLLNYLEEHPDAAKRIKDDSTKKTTRASPELVKVLSILLGGEKAEGEEKEGAQK